MMRRNIVVDFYDGKNDGDHDDRCYKLTVIQSLLFFSSLNQDITSAAKTVAGKVVSSLLLCRYDRNYGCIGIFHLVMTRLVSRWHPISLREMRLKPVLSFSLSLHPCYPSAFLPPPTSALFVKEFAVGHSRVAVVIAPHDCQVLWWCNGNGNDDGRRDSMWRFMMTH